jgi:hypothetical protein
MYLKIEAYDNGKPILYGLNNMRAPYGVSMLAEDIQLDVEGKKSIPEGSFVVGVGEKVRFLPRARNSVAVASSSPSVVFSTPAQTFLVGDVLHFLGGFAEITFGGAVATGDTVGIKLGDVVYAVTSAGTSLATLAASFVTANSAALAAVGVNVTQKGSSSTLVFMSVESLPVAYYASNGATSVTVATTEPGYLGDHILPIGTVLAVGPALTNGTRTITLAANAAYNVPVGCSIGVMVDRYLGIYPEPLDFTRSPRDHIAPIVEADGVYEQNLPYIDEQLKRRFDDLRINKRFYKKVA